MTFYVQLKCKCFHKENFYHWSYNGKRYEKKTFWYLYNSSIRIFLLINQKKKEKNGDFKQHTFLHFGW